MFESVVFFVFLAFAGLIAFLTLQQARKTGERRKAMLWSLAQRLPQGRVVGNSWLVPPHLYFSHRGRAAWVDFYSTGGKHPVHYTDLCLELSTDPAWRLSIEREGLLSAVGKMLGMQDIQTSDETFDRLFLIRSSDEARTHAFLTEAMRGTLLELYGFRREGMSLTAQDGVLRVRKLDWIEEEHQLESCITTAQGIFDGYLDTIGALSREAEPPAGAGLPCPVCHDLLTGPASVCEACGARHHPECFEINDGCAECGSHSYRSSAG
jgi:hypothetical protein